MLQRLIADADVLVQNLAPGAATRLGLSHAALAPAPAHPRLIVCDISGYGDDAERAGPLRDAKAYDLLIQAASGFLSVTGTPDTPVKAGCSVADIAAGMRAYAAILAAPIERGRSGRGRRIDISMLEAMVEWMGFPLYYAFDGAPPPPRSGAAHATICPYGPYPTGDGRQVLLGVQNEREWRAFCERVLQRPALAADARFADNTRRNAARDALHAIVAEAFSTLTAAQVVQRLDAAGIANAPLNDMAQVWAHPQLAARRRWVEVDTPAGPVPALLPPAARDAGDACNGAVPALGAHTGQVLAAPCYDDAQIDALRRDGVV